MTDNILNVVNLVPAGYRPFRDRMETDSMKDWYRGSYQKRIVDDTGTRYFITVSHSVIPYRPSHPERDSFSVTSQFTREGTTFNVEMLFHHETVEQMEAFFDDMWTKMGLDYYEGGPEAERGYGQR